MRGELAIEAPRAAHRTMRLRARLILLVASAAAPALLLLVLQTFDAYRDARELAHERGLLAARAAANAYGRALRTAETLLAIAANSPAVSPASPAACSDVLGQLSRAHHSRKEAAHFAAIFAVAPSGEVFCSSDPSRTRGLNFGDRPYFQNALISRSFFAGEHVMGRHSAEMLIPMALPKLSQQGDVSAVLVMGLRLAWLGRSSVLEPPPGAVVTVLSDDGDILARSHDHESWVGRRFPWSDAIERSLNGNGEGFTERQGVDGVDRLFTFKRLEVGPNAFYLLVGYEAEDVFLPAERTLLTGLALVALAALLVLATAAYGSRRLIGEPVRRLSEAADRMSRGDLSVRVEVPRGSELAGLGAAFNDMASALQARAEALADANDMLSAIINSSPFAIFAVDAETHVLSWNPAAEQTFGWTRDEIMGRKYPAVPEDQTESFTAMRTRALSGELLREYEAERVRKDGRRIRMRFSAAPLRSGEGSLRGTLYIGEDVTERRSLEEQFAQSQKMEAVGQLTGGIAHDFNNLLQVILGCADLLLERLPNGDKQRQLAEMMQGAAERGAGLTRQLLAFSRRQALEPVQLDANEVVHGLASLLRRTLGEAVSLETMLDRGLGLAFVDRGQLESALVNLAVNARDAMPSGGRLLIETANVELDADYAAQRAEVIPGEYVMVAVSDTGAGIPSDILPRIFEPFFTTKPAGKGTGLGLSMVFGFIKQSKGHISAYSEVGHGTTLRLYLPRVLNAAETAQRSAEACAAAEGARPGQTILYVEDDPEVRKFGLIQLDALGYRVIQAGTADEAIAALASAERIDLLFTDVVLGAGMSGWDLAQTAGGMRPGVAVLFASGYSEAMITGDGMLRPGVQLIRKPYRRTDLARKLRDVLGESD